MEENRNIRRQNWQDSNVEGGSGLNVMDGTQSSDGPTFSLVVPLGKLNM